MTDRKRYKVAIVYHFFAHYREPIVKTLFESDLVDYRLIAGTKKNPFYNSLKLIDFAGDDRFLLVSNKWAGGFYLWQSGLINILKNEKFDAVIFLGDWKFFSTWVAVWYLNKIKTPAFFWSHGILSEKRSLNNIIKKAFFNIFKSGGFVYNNRAKNLMASLGYNKQIEVVYNSLDYETQQEAIKSLDTDCNPEGVRLPKNEFVIFSGRIEARKNLSLLVDAIAHLKARGRNVDAVIIGTGDYLTMLEKYAEDKSVREHFLFYGKCYDEKILAAYFSQSVACVVPSAIGLTAIHALTYGVPVITNDDIYSHGPEVEAIEEGKNGSFFKKNDASSLADKIESFASLSAIEIEKFRENAKKIIKERFTPAYQLSVFNRRLTEVLDNR